MQSTEGKPSMKLKVTDAGLTIPKSFLEGTREVEVRQEGNRLIVIPLQEEDPIWSLGSNPVACEAPDASSQPDQYLYGFAE
jgi:virulence-associated protein VagC